MRSPEERAYDPQASVRAQAQMQLQAQTQAREIQSRLGATEARQPGIDAEGRNQLQQAGDMALEFTGLPQVRRGASEIARGDVYNDPQRSLAGVGEFGLGALNVATLGVGARPSRPVPRLPARDPISALRPEPPRIATPDAGDAWTGSAENTVSALDPQFANRTWPLGRSAGARSAEQGAAVIRDGRFMPSEAAYEQAMRSPTPPDGGRTGAGQQQPRLRRAAYDVANTTVMRNPSEADLFRMIGAQRGNTEANSVRAIVDTDGNVYAWRAMDAIHDDVARALRRIDPENEIRGYTFEAPARGEARAVDRDELLRTRGLFMREGDELFYQRSQSEAPVPAREVLRPALPNGSNARGIESPAEGPTRPPPNGAKSDTSSRRKAAFLLPRRS